VAVDTDGYVYSASWDDEVHKINGGQGTSINEKGEPSSYVLRNQPNPFTRSTRIRYELPTTTEVRLTVYDASGQKVSTLAQGRKQAGEHTATFNASDHPAGLYFYRLEAGDRQATGKMVLQE
ncbi:MAG: T9SS type A sorting domain-containing protein, partial [Flavobacteriales bacterium]